MPNKGVSRLVTIASLLLALSLTLLLIVLLSKNKNKKIRSFLGGFALFYILFVAMAFFSYKSSLANIDQIKNQSADMETKINTRAKSLSNNNQKNNSETAKKKDSKPLEIEEHGEFSGKVGQKLIITFTITNNSLQDIENLKIVFDKSGFSNLMVINTINPKAQIIRNTFIFGKLAAGSKQTYTIETYPSKTGSYESPISFSNGNQPIKDKNAIDIKDYVKVTVQ